MLKQRKDELSTVNWIVKSNALNEIRHTKMTVSQARLFAIYLSKINPRDISSREISFKLDEYAKIMQFQRFNITQLRESAVDLTKIVIHFDESDGKGGFKITSNLLFRCFKFHKNSNGDWIVSIDCHDDILHLMFDLKKYFFKYRLWNALQLPSPNQQRIYELLKQYEYVGAREISVKDLREFLSLGKDEYSRWNNFKVRILDASQIALKKHTDIKFTWEATGKRGVGGKINTLKFNIEKNEDYERQLTIDEFLSEQNPMVFESDTHEFVEESENRYEKRLSFFSDACDNIFTREEMQDLCYLMSEKMQHIFYDDLRCHDYLQRKYKEMLMNDKKGEGVRYKYRYMRSLIGTD